MQAARRSTGQKDETLTTRPCVASAMPSRHSPRTAAVDRRDEGRLVILREPASEVAHLGGDDADRGGLDRAVIRLVGGCPARQRCKQ
jgi:hypothetical protein